MSANTYFAPWKKGLSEFYIVFNKFQKTPRMKINNNYFFIKNLKIIIVFNGKKLYVIKFL